MKLKKQTTYKIFCKKNIIINSKTLDKINDLNQNEIVISPNLEKFLNSQAMITAKVENVLKRELDKIDVDKEIILRLLLRKRINDLTKLLKVNSKFVKELENIDLVNISEYKLLELLKITSSEINVAKNDLTQIELKPINLKKKLTEEEEHLSLKKEENELYLNLPKSSRIKLMMIIESMGNNPKLVNEIIAEK